MEANQMSMNRWMGKQDVHTLNEILFSLKKKWNSDTCYNINFEDIMLSEIRPSQKDKYCMIWLKWNAYSIQNHGDKVEQWWPGARGKGRNEDLLFQR